MKKSVTYLSGFLGFGIFAFGVLKLVQPIKGKYEAQIVSGGLPETLHPLGITLELLSGVALLLVAFLGLRLGRLMPILLQLGSLGIVVITCVACYVHLHPAVPAEVLPLDIKPPVLPGTFLLLALLNLYLAARREQPLTA